VILISGSSTVWPTGLDQFMTLEFFKILNLFQAFEQGIINGVLLGDSGYPLKPWLLTPFLNPTTPAQRNYNAAHCSTRNTVERAFGVLKRRFHCLHGELRMTPDRVCNIICATVVLHNIAR